MCAAQGLHRALEQMADTFYERTGVALDFDCRIPELRLSADVDWTAHRRRAGYLSTDGDAVAVLAHGAWLFGAADERVRPSAGGGLGVLRSTGRLDLAGDSTDWSITKPVWELNGGLRIALNRRLALRSEYRFRNTVGGRSGRTGLEPPLLGMQAMVSVDVGLR